VKVSREGRTPLGRRRKRRGGVGYDTGVNDEQMRAKLLVAGVHVELLPRSEEEADQREFFWDRKN